MAKRDASLMFLSLRVEDKRLVLSKSGLSAIQVDLQRFVPAVETSCFFSERESLSSRKNLHGSCGKEVALISDRLRGKEALIREREGSTARFL